MRIVSEKFHTYHNSPNADKSAPLLTVVLDASAVAVAVVVALAFELVVDSVAGSSSHHT